MSKAEQTKERGTNFTDVRYANYETSFTRTYLIFSNKIFSITNGERAALLSPPTLRLSLLLVD
jgi:hypothetical protein